jgi:hypothetical protein
MSENNNEAEQWKTIHPSLDFTSDHAYFGQIIGDRRENSYCIITDQGYVLPTDPEDTLEYHHLKLAQQPYVYSVTRWTSESINRFSRLKRYPTEEPIALDKTALLSAIKDLFAMYIEFSDEQLYSFFTLWSIGTYCFPLFNTYPYVHLIGLMQSGKSKLLSLCCCLSFNGFHSADITTACLFRLIEETRGSLFIDEAETLSSRRGSEAVRGILLSGYRKGGKAYRAERDSDGNFVPRAYDVYGPKMMANIEGLEEVLASRCITVTMQRGVNKEIVNSEINIDYPGWQQIRDRIYPFIMVNWEEIRRVYNELQNEAEIFGRERELWKPILALAKFFGNEVYAEMKALAVDKVAERNNNSVTEEQVLLETLLSLVTDHGFYNLKEISIAMASRLDCCSWLDPRRVARLLRTLGFTKTRRMAQGTEFKLETENVKATARRLGVSVDSADSADAEEKEVLEEKPVE